LIQPRSNYIFPNDARLIASRDTDDDGMKDLSPLGADKFFDPSKLAASGGKIDMKARPVKTDPQNLSGDKVDHAVSYANTAFSYFAEENHASPITLKQADHLISTGWYKSDGDEVARFTPRKKDGETYYEVAINSKYSGQSKEALAAMVLVETEKYLCKELKGKYTTDDQLQGILMAGDYVDLFCKYAEDCDGILKALGEKYGYANMAYDTLFEAGKREEHVTGAPAAIEYLKRKGVGPVDGDKPVA
jgi:hypothetical protein